MKKALHDFSIRGRVRPVLVGGVALVTCMGIGTFAIPAAHATVDTAGSARFAYSPTSQTFTVPAGVYELTVVADGGSGGEGAYDRSSIAGEGAQVSGTLAVSPGEVLTINVGDHGQSGTYTGPLDEPQGGYSAIGFSGGNGRGRSNGWRTSGAGGGATTINDSTHTLLIAGGGGGSGGSNGSDNNFIAGGDGGDAGVSWAGQSGSDGHGSNSGQGGAGGNQSGAPGERGLDGERAVGAGGGGGAGVQGGSAGHPGIRTGILSSGTGGGGGSGSSMVDGWAFKSSAIANAGLGTDGTQAGSVTLSWVS